MPTAILLLALCAAADARVDTIVVCPAEFREALAPWTAHRESQGHRLRIIANLQSPLELRREIRQIAAQAKVRNLVLVGDAEVQLESDATVRRRCVPTQRIAAVVNVRFGSEPEIASDNWYADLDDDRIPDIAVGRLTADSAAELTLIVSKILAYERSADFGHWRRQVQFVAGLGGFGALADTVLEAAAKGLITRGIPPAYATSMTYGSWQSPYCPDPRKFRQVALDRLNEGSLFWIYLGHGQQQTLDRVRVPGGSFPILSTSDTLDLACRHGATIACLLACYSGAFDQPRDCLAEEMLRCPGGPVAVLCGTRVTMPYGLTVLGSELLRECFVEQPETIGQAVLAAKRRAARPSDAPERAALDALAKAISPPGSDLDAERAEHNDLLVLLGDPLLRLPFPKQTTVEIPAQAMAGERISVKGRSPITGSCTVELVVRRDRLTFQPPGRARFDATQLAGYSTTYQQANQPRLALAEFKVEPGPYSAELDVPASARGACHVRVFVEGRHACAAGAADVRIDAANPN